MKGVRESRSSPKTKQGFATAVHRSTRCGLGRLYVDSGDANERLVIDEAIASAVTALLVTRGRRSTCSR